jgi:hypothetical protein
MNEQLPANTDRPKTFFLWNGLSVDPTRDFSRCRFLAERVKTRDRNVYGDLLSPVCSKFGHWPDVDLGSGPAEQALSLRKLEASFHTVCLNGATPNDGMNRAHRPAPRDPENSSVTIEAITRESDP